MAITLGTSVSHWEQATIPLATCKKSPSYTTPVRRCCPRLTWTKCCSASCVIARDYFHLQNVAILLLDKDKNQLCMRSQIGGEAGFSDVCISIGTGLVGTAAKEKRPLYVPDFSKETRYLPWGKKTCSELAIPLMVRDEVVGVLDCQSENPDHFDRETVDLLTLFSTQASMALQNAHLYSLERRRASQLEAINAIARETTVVLDIKNLLSKACEKIQKAFEVSHVSIFLKDEEGLLLRAHHGDLTLLIAEGGRLPSGKGLLGRALNESKTLIENDIKTRAGLPRHLFGDWFPDVYSADFIWANTWGFSSRQRPHRIVQHHRNAIARVSRRYLRHGGSERPLR